MARSTSLDGRWSKARKAYELNVPPDLSDNGKRRRLFFQSKEEMEKAETMLRLRKAGGNPAQILNFQRMVEAAEIYQRYDEHCKQTDDDKTLREIVIDYFRSYKGKYKSVTLVQLYREFLKRKPRSKKYLRQVEYCLEKFPERESKQVSELTVEDIETAFKGIPSGNRNAYLRYLRGILNYGMKKGYLKENPILRMDFTYRPRQKVHAIPNRLVKAMFEHAWEHNQKFIPFLVLAFFCGVRTDAQEGEITKVLWSDFDLERKRLRMRSEITKIKKQRYIPLCEAAIAWLERTESPFGAHSEVLGSFTPQTLRTAKESNWEVIAEGREWFHNGFRHTFASNFVALYGVPDARQVLGHEEEELTSQRYDAGIPKEKAEEFFSIMPPYGE